MASPPWSAPGSKGWRAGRKALPASLFIDMLSNELDHLPEDFILVLDDYSTIRGQAVHDFLNGLLQHLPHTMHMVLITRTSPPLTLSRLRVRGEVNEIRGRDLHFTSEESAAFLKRSQGAFLSQEELDLQENSFESWPAGLRLLSLSFRFAGSHESLSLALGSLRCSTGLPDIGGEERFIEHPGSKTQSRVPR